MGFFDSFIWVMEIAVLVFAGIVVVLFVAIAMVGRRNRRLARRERQVTEQWRALLLGDVPLSGAPDVPELTDDHDRFTLLLLYNELCLAAASAGDPVAPPPAGIVRQARSAGLEDYARRILDEGDDTARVPAYYALAMFGAADLGGRARTDMAVPGTELSRAAAGYLTRTDPAALGDVLDQVRRRPDWERARVEVMLRSAGTGRVDAALPPALERSLADGDEAGTVRLLGYTGCCSDGAARSACHRSLDLASDSEITAAALRALADVADAADVAIGRRYAVHADAHVRLGALRVLRAVASPDDVPLIRSLVTDPDFWVRRRAAEALVALDDGSPGSGGGGALSGLSDPYARDAVTEAVAAARFAADVGRRPGAPAPTGSAPG